MCKVNKLISYFRFKTNNCRLCLFCKGLSLGVLRIDLMSMLGYIVSEKGLHPWSPKLVPFFDLDLLYCCASERVIRLNFDFWKKNM